MLLYASLLEVLMFILSSKLGKNQKSWGFLIFIIAQLYSSGNYDTEKPNICKYFPLNIYNRKRI